jgi:hypothetical protein
MRSIDERVAYLEGRIEDHAGTVGDLRSSVRDLNGTVHDLAEQMDRRFGWLDGRVIALDQKVERVFHRLDAKITWVVGIQIAVLVAIIGALMRSYPH